MGFENKINEMWSIIKNIYFKKIVCYRLDGKTFNNMSKYFKEEVNYATC